MKKKITLPSEILEIFKVVKSMVPNMNASHRPALLNSMLLANHPASCRAKSNKAPNLSPNIVA